MENKEYENQNLPYDFERHRNALDLNFRYLGNDRYELPKNWGEGLQVDLSATGNEQFQILKSVCKQLVKMVKEARDV